ncbi:MAG: exodeoxyribonuclease VII large subunit [Planctomycetota bacterium]
MSLEIYTVTQLQTEVRTLLENGYRHVWLEAEISGHRRYPSGHHYLTLKDDGAQLNAVIWRSTADRLSVQPENGLAVRARGTLTIYPPRGSYQIMIDRLEPLGVGALQQQFEKMRRQLEEEGLFDPGHKQPLPALPRRIALVTSPAGAAVRDIIRVAGRRWPLTQLVVVPVRVQGDGAREEIADAIARADRLGFDLMIVGRGGGSLEDLWAFNEEIVARAIHAAETPIVSAVGHEVDVTIADLVADVRAATPSAAAELVTPDRDEQLAWLRDRERRMARALAAQARELRLRLDRIASARSFRRPLDVVHEAERRLDELAGRMGRAARERVQAQRLGLEAVSGRLEALSPLKVLARGFSVTWKNETLVRSVKQVRPGDRLRTTLPDGEIESTMDS